MTNAKDAFRDFILDQLDGIADLRAKRMFGAYGVYCGDVFFAILHDGRLFLKTDETTQPEFEARGMEAFQPTPKQRLKSYFEVPVEVVERPEDLVEWARRSIRVARG